LLQTAEGHFVWHLFVYIARR